MHDSAYQILGAALGYLLALLVRRAGRDRFWKRVADSAERMLKDPAIPIDDPHEAAEAALANEQHERVIAVARTISKTIPPPYAGRTPSRLIERPFNGKVDHDDTPRETHKYPHDTRYHIRKGDK